jgi:hypothetical protein
VGTTDLDFLFIRHHIRLEPSPKLGPTAKAPDTTVRGAHASKTAKRWAAAIQEGADKIKCVASLRRRALSVAGMNEAQMLQTRGW